VPKTPGKGYFARDKTFVGCSTRQRAAAKKSIGKDFYARCFLSGTWQTLCRVQTRHPVKKSGRHGTKSVSPWFAGCHVKGTRQRFFIFFKFSLPSALPERHPAKIFLIFL
jgi:hypothetical protein